jgi:hypothetical protein
MISSQTRSQGTLAKLRLAAMDVDNEMENSVITRGKLQELIREFEENKDPSVKWETAADAAGFKGIYDAIYRTTSADSAHVTLDALSRHLGDGYQQGNYTVEFGPSEQDLAETLTLAIGAMSHCLMAFGRAYKRTEVEQQGILAVAKSRDMLR